MKRKFSRVAVFALSMIMMLGWTDAMANFEPFASTRFFTKSVSLSTSLSATFRAETYEECSQLGLRSYSLYESDGTWVTGVFLQDYKASDTYSKTINLSSYGKSGKSYYVIGIMFADGETKSVTSGTIKH